MLLVLFALGCSSKNLHGSGYAPGYGGHGGGYGGDAVVGSDYGGEYDYADDLDQAMGESEAMVVSEAPAREQRARYKASKKIGRRDAAAKPAPTTPASATGSSEAEPPAPPEPGDEPVANYGRQIIYTAGMGLSVFDVNDVMAKLEAIPERHGGWLHQRYDNSVILRVPAAKLQTIIDEISEWGVVDYKTLEALDVTAEYTDLDSRIRTLEQMQAQLQALLARAESVEQALEIQMELSRITSELESLHAQMRMLESSIAFSTLAVELRERGTAEPEPGDDPFAWVDELGVEITEYR